MSSTTSSSGKPAKGSRRLTFFRRSGSTIALVALIGTGLYFAEPWLFFLLISILGILGTIEYFQMLQLKDAKWESRATTAIASVYLIVHFWIVAANPEIDHGLLGGASIFAVLAICFILHLGRAVTPGVSHVNIMACVFGFVYIAFLFSFVTRIAFFDDRFEHWTEIAGRTYLLFLLATAKCTDIGAYLTGSLLGKRKMIPHISPAKTWEGFFGAIGFAFLAAFTVKWLMGDDIPLLTNGHVAILALLISLGAVMGDLAESILKRSLATKDSGQVMPGIGGVLDLIDSLIFTAPIYFFYLTWLNR